jgi:hypothetical protein
MGERQPGTYAAAMSRPDSPAPPDPVRGLLDRLPILGQATTPRERSSGPCCLLNVLIVSLLTLLLRRFLALSIGVSHCWRW